MGERGWGVIAGGDHCWARGERPERRMAGSEAINTGWMITMGQRASTVAVSPSCGLWGCRHQCRWWAAGDHLSLGSGGWRSPLPRRGLVRGRRLIGFSADEVGGFVSFFPCKVTGWDRYRGSEGNRLVGGHRYRGSERIARGTIALGAF